MITRHILSMDENSYFVVDDPPGTISDITCEYLEDEEDIHVTAIRAYIEDVVEIEKLQPDLILIYLILNGTQQRAWTCVQHLKSHPATKDIPVLLYGHHPLEMFEYLEQEQGPILTLSGVMFLQPSLDMDELLSCSRQLLADAPSLS